MNSPSDPPPSSGANGDPAPSDASASRAVAPNPAIPASFAAEYPFASHWVDLDGVRYHHLDEGQGPPVLMVHGNPTWSFAWRRFVGPLSRVARVLAVDHVGCGLSDKPLDYEYRLRTHIDNLVRFVERHDLRGITLVAHDWGGAIGMGAAARMPDRFARFVLCNTAAFRSTRMPWRIAVCRWPVIGPLGVRGLNLFSRAALTMAVAHRERITPAVRAGYLHPYDSWDHRVAVQRFVEDIPLHPSHPSWTTLVEVEEGLAQFRDRPLLLAWGEQDWCFTMPFLREFQERFPKAETVTYPDAGHYVFEDAHERLVPAALDFLRRHGVR